MKTKGLLISFAVTAKLIRTFVFAEGLVRFSRDKAHLMKMLLWQILDSFFFFFFFFDKA